MRLNKFLSHNTKYSRREAESVIAKGVVRINKEVVTDPARDVSEEDRVFINKRAILPKQKGFITAIVYNKPKGEIVSKRDERGRKTIYDTLPAKFSGFVPIGRLDYATTGLLMLTDSKEAADKLMRSKLERVYIIKIKGDVTQSMENAMNEGLENVTVTEGGHEKSDIKTMSFAPFYAYKIDKNAKTYSRLKIAIGEGKNREIRRFFAYFNREVVDLKRISFGGVELNALPEGKFRFFSKNEYSDLKSFLLQEDDINI